MKLTRKEVIEILKYAVSQIERRDLETWQLVVMILRYAAETIEKYEKQ